MAKYDKYDPISGGFRAHLAEDLTLTDGSIGPVAVSLDTAGRVQVDTAGESGLVGILVKNVAKGPIGPWGTSLQGGTPNPYAPIGSRAGDVVDIMTQGEIVDLDPVAFPPGSKVFAAANGTLNVTGGAGSIQVGWMAGEGTARDPLRMIVRVAAGTPAQA